MTLQELREYHAEQADHFSPFGANNALTKFHGDAAALLQRTEPITADLLAALEDCTQWLASFDEFAYGADHLDDVMKQSDRWKRCQAAIARAKGEA